MKKAALFLICFSGTVALWAGLTAGDSDYRRIENAPLSFTRVFVGSPDPGRMVRFYENVLGTRSQAASNIRKLIPAGRAVRTPGYGGRGPVFVFYKSAPDATRGALQAYERGFAHICFESDDVRGMLRRILENGGGIVSTFEDPEASPVVYAADPDGNLLEVHLPLPTPFTPRTLLRSLASLFRTFFKLKPAEPRIRFLHVNLNSSDWTGALGFYANALGVAPTGFKRDYEGEFIARLTGVTGAVVRGRHGALPGYSAGGPTLEFFSYRRLSARRPAKLSDPGIVGLGFEVRDLETSLEKLRSSGAELLRRRPDEALLGDLYGNRLLIYEHP